MKGDPRHLGFSTRAIHGGQPPDAQTGAVAVPIYQTSTYVQDELGRNRGFDYARVRNPTRDALEENVALLEGGLSAHAFASGMAAISALASLVESGGHIVASHDVYGGTYRYFSRFLERSGVGVSWVDTSRLDTVEAAITPATRLLYVETPSNPRMAITDLAAAAALCRRRGLTLAVDNTLLTPYLQRPLEHGADLVVHSTTKFLNGHSDSLGGVVVTTQPAHRDWLAFVQKAAGAILAPFEAFLILRGIKTLAVRMDRHEANASAIAHHLAEHPKVRHVAYPGLPRHPGHSIHKRQARGFGAVVLCDLGSYEAAKRFLDHLRIMSLAESLGGVETLAGHPASMTHASIPAARREHLGIGEGMVRLSIGIEDLDDLVADLDQALAAV